MRRHPLLHRLAADRPKITIAILLALLTALLVFLFVSIRGFFDASRAGTQELTSHLKATVQLERQIYLTERLAHEYLMGGRLELLSVFAENSGLVDQAFATAIEARPGEDQERALLQAGRSEWSQFRDAAQAVSPAQIPVNADRWEQFKVYLDRVMAGLDALHRIDQAKAIEQHDAAYRMNRNFLIVLGVAMGIVFAGLISNVVAVLRSQARYKERSLRDPLTGLYNRRKFDMQLIEEAEQARSSNTAFSLLIADLDRFKFINDTHGHLAGDEVLREVACRIRQAVRTTDLVFRIGGEEFAVILPGTSGAGAVEVAERIRTLVGGEPVRVTEHQAVLITVSVGASTYPDLAPSQEDLVLTADQALYAAKGKGRDRVQWFTPFEHQDRLSPAVGSSRRR